MKSGSHKIGETKSLELAIKKANEYMEENEVEYGLTMKKVPGRCTGL